jgi:putative SOS response-associated peptidase YedK
MCGRYSLVADPNELQLLFDLPEFDVRLAVPRYNIAPTQPIVVVRTTDRGRELVPMRWGFIPGWAKDPDRLPLMINARAESIAEKSAFRGAIRRRRCLVPASGFYEWQTKAKGPKQPFWIRPTKPCLLAFAGIWETWAGADGSEIDTAAIITTTCNEELRPLHERMPVVVAPENFQLWLSGEAMTEAALSLLRPASEDAFTSCPVSTRVNAVANDDPSLWEIVAAETAPAAAPASERKAAPDQLLLL